MHKIKIEAIPYDTKIRVMLDKSLNQNQFEGKEYAIILDEFNWVLREDAWGDPLTDDDIQCILDAAVEIAMIEILRRETATKEEDQSVNTGAERHFIRKEDDDGA